MLKLKLQYFGHLMQRANSFEKTLVLENIEGWRIRGDRGQDGWMASLTMDMSLSKLQEIVKDGSLACCSPWGRKESDTTEAI